ncbi:DHH family phosphoesterase [Lacticaseibacillus saniviri]|uniref:Phosphoesterase, DHH family protein n=1 Tax=Lacticaseibacillus saniviri JCM 17471 = DSM 24301 TaxID=1293598 RepID=A0A0R2MZN8_9LACO|nr:bifunctional oligoribonuclease/PAP phosphatase NrnA [Lacticaseibacillus saniviri]KRO17970.1 phosphoesterase, DHH family protein [Lacticaseibacillus saniviri JCM 17471 = DSM 24301]MCG4282332.1 bifunctional oligoribonuclease/PAP phosphatase NrnA [Lacticaseibacillus saniviri]
MTIQQDIFNAIEQNDVIIIHRHERPDPDALGSQVGLATTIKATFPDKSVYAVGDGDVGNLSWLAEMDEIPDETYRDALVIVTDTADTPRVANQRYNMGKMLIKIDHHPNDDPYGDITWVDTTASSTSELLMSFIDSMDGKLKLVAPAARLFYAGIVGDTGRFMFNNTTPHTLETAAKLISYDFDPTAVNQKMNEITLSQARLQGEVFENLHIEQGGAAYTIITRQRIKELGLEDDQVQAAVNTPSRLGNVLAWMLFVEQVDGTYRVNLRSKGPIINELAKAHNGGGHPLASGAKAADKQEIDQMVQELITIATNYEKE